MVGVCQMAEGGKKHKYVVGRWQGFPLIAFSCALRQPNPTGGGGVAGMRASVANDFCHPRDKNTFLSSPPEIELLSGVV